MKIKIHGEQSATLTQSPGLQIATGVVVMFFALAVPVIVVLLPDVSAAIKAIAGVLGLAGVIAGIVICRRAKSTTVTVNIGGQTTIVHKRAFGGPSTSQQLNTADIGAVNLDSGYDLSFSAIASNPGQQKATLRLFLRNGQTVDLFEEAYTTVGSSGPNIAALVQTAPMLKQSKKLAEFLKVPLEDRNPFILKGENLTAETLLGSPSNPANLAPTQQVPSETTEKINPPV